MPLDATFPSPNVLNHTYLTSHEKKANCVHTNTVLVVDQGLCVLSQGSKVLAVALKNLHH